MTSIDYLLVAVGGWLLVSLLVVPLAQPLLSAVGRADRQEAAGRQLVRTRPRALATPKSAGYAGLVLERLLWHGCVVHGAQRACLLVRDELGRLVVVAGHEIDVDLLGRRFPSGAGRRPASVSGLPDGVRIPIEVDGRERGLLALSAPTGEAKAAATLERELAALIGIVLAHRDSGELPHADSRPEIATLIATLQAADHQTESHCQSVAALACAVGRELELDAAALFELELTARLHDVGKLHVPRAILDKPGPLDAQERELVRMHPEWGAEIVGRIPGLAAVALLVLLHHERMDGTGYPFGLPAERIPAASRIVAVCDAHSAIVDDRPYRAGRTESEALEELRRHAGTQFDPAVVAALERTVMLVH
jgi:HD-GYP domain-containing protein (c-di-GMP phosphodiesterase class II)